MHEATFTLTDGDRTLNVRARANGNFLELSPEGYSECEVMPGDGSPLLLDLFEGRLRAIVFADITTQEPTDIIDLEGCARTGGPTPPTRTSTAGSTSWLRRARSPERPPTHGTRALHGGAGRVG